MVKNRPLTNKHIVFDLDETLVHSDQDMEKFERLKIYSKPNASLKNKTYVLEMVNVTEQEGTGEYVKMWGVFRPHLFEFMDFVLKYYTVHVWSAGQKLYVHSIVEQIFDDNDIPDVIFSREKCDQITKGRENMIFKPLTKFFDVYSNAKPENTLIIDDRPDTFSKNEKNGILIPPFLPSDDKESFDKEDILNHDDKSLLELMKWLKKPEVMNAKDVRTLDKKHIFSKI